MHPLLKPIFALRLFTLAATILLIAVLFLFPKDSGAPGFLLRTAIGLSVGVQTMVWNRQLRWRNQEERLRTMQLILAQPQV
jgi:hypothetical protein